jgi:hypothetical protein
MNDKPLPTHEPHSSRRRDGEIFSNSDCAAAVVQDLDCLEPKNLVSKYKTQKKEHT